jgi:hypothetical protein
MMKMLRPHTHTHMLLIHVFLFLCSHNDRTTQWEDPRTQMAAQALSHGNLFSSSSSEHSSVETLFSTPTQLGSLGSSSQNGMYNIAAYGFYSNLRHDLTQLFVGTILHKHTHTNHVQVHLIFFFA